MADFVRFFLNSYYFQSSQHIANIITIKILLKLLLSFCINCVQQTYVRGQCLPFPKCAHKCVHFRLMKWRTDKFDLPDEPY